MKSESGVTRDCLTGAPRRRFGWTAVAVPVVAAGLVFGAVAVAQSHPRQEHEQVDPDNQDHYSRMLAEVKQDEEQARAEISDALRADSDTERADRLVRVANRHRLAGESTRQAYVKAAASLRDDSETSRVLRKLLGAAPITEDTGRAVLAAVEDLRTEAERLRVLRYFHELQEAGLVRGPLASAYLDVAEELEGSEALGEALRGLLHPVELDPAHTLRALKLAERLDRDEDRMKVLREVTDHQVLTGEVMDAYRAVERSLEASASQQLSRDRFEAARDGFEDFRRDYRNQGPRAYALRMNVDDKADFDARMAELKVKMKELKARMQRDLGEEIDLNAFDVKLQ